MAEPKRKKIEKRIPVVTEDIVTYLLQNVNENGKFFNIFEFIASEKNIATAWFEIKSRFGMLTKSEDKTKTDDEFKTMESFPLKWLKEISELLVVEKYSYKPARILKISKKKKSKFRKFIITNLSDKIVQKAFQRVLNLVFEGYSEWEKIDEKKYTNYFSGMIDYSQKFKKKIKNVCWVKKFKIKPIFSSKSYGFRSKKGVHSVLRVIEKTWYPNWFSFCDVSKIFDTVNKNILIKRLKEYIDDEQFIKQIRKMFDVQIININLNTKSGILNIPQNSMLSSLLFNLYMHPLDKFVENVIENVTKRNKKKLNFEYKRMIKLDSKKIKKISAKMRDRITKKPKKLVKKFYIKKLLNDSKKTPVRMYYARYANDYILGFFMSKINMKIIIKNIITFIINDLKLEVIKTTLKCSTSNKVPFLGFEIRAVLPEKFNYYRKKEFEAYRRHKNNVLRKGVQEYEKFLKMVEWLGRRAIANAVNKKIVQKKNLVKKKELKKMIPEITRQKNWFYKKHKHNKKVELAYKNRYDKQQHIFGRWIKASQRFINSEEISELAKMIGKNKTNKLLVIRKNMLSLSKELIGTKIKKVYLLKQQLVKKDLIKIIRVTKLIPKLEIFFPKKQIIQKFITKGILNSKGMPKAVMQKTTLPDYKIIDWYTTVAEGLLSYYGCANNLNDLRRLVSWSLRYSLFATIGAKHKKSIRWAIDNFGFDPKVKYKNEIIASFPAAGSINSCKKKYPTQIWNNKNLYSIINNEHIRLNLKITLFNICGVEHCSNLPKHVYYIQYLNRIWKSKLTLAKIKKKNHQILFLQQTVQSALACKQVPLCQKCHISIYKGIVVIGNLNKKYIITNIGFVFIK